MTHARICGAVISKARTFVRLRKARPWTGRSAGRASGVSAGTASPWRRGEPTRTGSDTIHGLEVGVHGLRGVTVLARVEPGCNSARGNVTTPVRHTVEVLAWETAKIFDFATSNLVRLQ